MKALLGNPLLTEHVTHLKPPHLTPDRTEALISDIRITPALFSDIISKLDCYKASGEDGILAVAFKKCTPELIPVFPKLYNNCLAVSYLSACWNSSNVVPDFKNAGEPSDPSNYCPNSLLPIFDKEHLLTLCHH